MSPSSAYRIVYRGNHSVDFSTESHVAASMEELGHIVIRHQENEIPWAESLEATEDADVLWWTSTYGYAQQWDQDEARGTLAAIGERIPTVGQHLDLWIGLNRQDQLASNPFFRVDYLFTADGDHDDVWAVHGIRHRWMPPAVYGAECVPGTPRREYRSDVAFVGSWQHYGHEEWWPQRQAMLSFIKRNYRARFWPQRQAIRGQALNDLYASCKVAVGDSCFADRSRRYFSDRYFECVGRGGFLVAPWIEGAAEMLVDGKHCRYFPPGDHAELKRLIDWYLDPAHERERREIVTEGQNHVRENHTYRHRVQAILDVLAAEGAL